MPNPYAFREELISQIPALQLLMALGYQYLTPDETLALPGQSEREVAACQDSNCRSGDR